ncbi:MAG: asparagine synthase-related protein, partial [Bacteroidota bacterium]
MSGALHVIKRDSITVFMSDALMKDKSTHLNIEENSIAGGKWRMDRSPALLNQQMNAQDFLDVWQKKGDEGINDFYGDFIFFYFDIKTKSLSLCRDQIGVIPLYFYRSPDYMVFSNSLKAVKDIVGERYLDEDKYWWTTHFLDYKNDLTGTYFQQIRMIPPGEIGFFTPVHQELRSYYSLKNKPKHLYTKESDYYERFHELLSRAVINRMDSNGPTGVELSGGLDSSSIAAIASKHQNIYSFSNVFLRKIRRFMAKGCMMKVSILIRLWNF